MFFKLKDKIFVSNYKKQVAKMSRKTCEENFQYYLGLYKKNNPGPYTHHSIYLCLGVLRERLNQYGKQKTSTSSN